MRHASGTRRGVTLIEMLVVLAIVVVLFGLLLRAVYYSREAGRRMGCQGNLHQVSMAMSHFVNAKGRLPNRPVAGSMSGWAIEILPFLEETALSDGLSGLPPIDSPAALALAAPRPAIMRCPSGYDGDSDILGVPASHYTAQLQRDVRADRCWWSIMDLPTDSRVDWVTSPEGGFGTGVSTWSMPHTGGYNEADGGGLAHQGVYYTEGR
jgi:prepilin-type N-terminal cleavage/methylation domain-containing protein